MGTQMGEFTMIDSKRRLYIPRSVCKLYEINKKELMEISVEYGWLCIQKFDSKVDISKRPYTGIVRWFYPRNRIGIPEEFCDLLGINEDVSLEINLNDPNKIRFRKC